MQENWLELADAFSADQKSVLATIIETKGATYQKVGTMMLVNDAGECSGLLSGGCLEADIALHCQQVLSENLSKVLHYDLTGDADLLWGLGGGCEGEIRILLQALTTANQHLGFEDALSHALNGKRGSYIQQNVSGMAPFGLFIANQPGVEVSEQKVAQAYNAAYNNHMATLQTNHLVENKNQQFINIPVYPPISILICGAGPDAVPVARFAMQLGWIVTLWDHRQAALSEPSFDEVNAKRKIRAEHIKSNELNAFDAMIVMTHNLENDQQYLATAIASKLPYIGLLGPMGRRNKLLENISMEYSKVSDRVFGPIGLNLGGRSPQAIALSIMAEIQQQMTALQVARCKKSQFMDVRVHASIQ